MGCGKCFGTQGPSFFAEYELGLKLGEGAFGQVRAVKDRETGQEFAVKIIDVRERDEKGEVMDESGKQLDKALLRLTEAEVAAWQQINPSVNVLQLIRSFQEGGLFYLVMEKCKASVMDGILVEDHIEVSTPADLVDIWRQMLLGIAHVHSCGMAHRDVKPDNFLYGLNEDNGQMILKLCDFGVTCKLPPTSPHLLHGICGTAPYMSPEMLADKGYNELTDVWSLGTTAYLMLFGNFPYTEANMTAVKNAILMDDPPITYPDPGACDETVDATKFVRELLQRSPEKRPSAAEALRLPFLQLDPSKIKGSGKKKSPGVRDIGPVLEMARQRTEEYKRPRNPIVQNSIDNLLDRLHSRFGGAEEKTSLFFSDEGGNLIGKPSTREEGGRIIARKLGRPEYHSHSGVIEVASPDGEQDTSWAASGRAISLPAGETLERLGKLPKGGGKGFQRDTGGRI